MAPISNKKDVGLVDAPLLSIVIPTFNRPTRLRATVAAILPQLTSECELLILDNASTPSASEALTDIVELAENHQCRINRNACNVGVIANVLRCFEYATGEWVWILGDDDSPFPNAVETALRNIREFSDALFINFRSDVCSLVSRDEGFPKVLNGLDGLFEGCDSFSNLLFVSSGLYRREIVPKYIGKAYYFCDTHAPHLSLLFLHLRMNGGTSVLSSEELVAWGKPAPNDGWDAQAVMMRMPELANIIPLLKTRSKFGALIEPIMVEKFYIRSFVALALLGDMESYARQMDDEVLALRSDTLFHGQIKIGSFFRLGLLMIISRLCPLIAWIGRIFGFRARRPRVPPRDRITRLLDDHRV